MDQLLSPFEAMGAAFIIEEPASLSEYGLDDPVCTIELTTEGGDYTILLGDYSTMDEQRYVSIGDGKVYLAVSDPLDEFDTTLADLIQNDAVPDFETVTAVTFSGAENYSFTLEENGTSYRDEDRYFADGLPLDTDRVEDYLLILKNLPVERLCDLQRHRGGDRRLRAGFPGSDHYGGLYRDGRGRNQ